MPVRADQAGFGGGCRPLLAVSADRAPGGAGSVGAPEGPSWWLIWQIRLPSATVVGWEPVVFRAINTLAANGDPGLGAEDRLALVARREHARRFVNPVSGYCQAARQTLSTAELPARRPQRGLGGHGQRSRDGRDRVPARRARRSGSTSTGNPPRRGREQCVWRELGAGIGAFTRRSSRGYGPRKTTERRDSSRGVAAWKASTPTPGRLCVQHTNSTPIE